MDPDVVEEIERLASRTRSSERKGYYKELQRNCARAPGAYEAILNTVLHCQFLLGVSKKIKGKRAAQKINARDKYKRFQKARKTFEKVFGEQVEKIDGALTFRLAPAEWPRDHMGIGKGSAETLINERGEMAGMCPGTFKSAAPKGGRPENVYMNIVFLMLDFKLREYRIRPRYETIGKLFYYFLDVGHDKESMYESDTVKRIIMRLRRDKTLLARVEAVFGKVSGIQPGPHRLRAAFPRDDSISF